MNPAAPPLPMTLDSCSGRGSSTKGKTGSLGGWNFVIHEPAVGKSLGDGGSNWPDGDTSVGS